jgi:hypothetical protein
MEPNLQLNFEYYIQHQDELVGKYNGRFLIIKDQEVKADFASYYEAFIHGSNDFGEGNFIVQYCAPGEESYTQTFHSRVRFV